MVLNNIFYLNKSGNHRTMLPKDLSKQSTGQDYQSGWKADGARQRLLDTLRRAPRTAAGREPEPSKAAIDSQKLKWSEAGRPRGYDGGKLVNGLKRHLIVHTLGLLLVLLVSPANADDGTHAPKVLANLTPAHTSLLDEIRGDRKCNNLTLNRQLPATEAKNNLTVVERPPGVTGLMLLPYRWVVERTIASTGKYRRNSKDYERTTGMSEAMVQATAIHLMLRRLARNPPTLKRPSSIPVNP